MSKKLLNALRSTRVHLLVIAACLIMAASVSGLLAYLVDYEVYTANLWDASGAEFGIELTGINYGTEYNNTVNEIIPGQEIPLYVELSNNADYDVYSFIQLEIPNEFEYDEYSLGGCWANFEGSTDVPDNVYVYVGNGNSMEKLEHGETEIQVLDNVIFRSDNALPIRDLGNEGIGAAPYAINVRAYAIQADCLPDNYSAESLWTLIGGYVST